MAAALPWLDEPQGVHAGSCAIWESDDPCTCEAWRDAASCAGLAPAESDRLFFSRGNGTPALAEAMRLCATCPVRRDCGAYAERMEVGRKSTLAHMSGIWGGEPIRVRHRRRRAARDE